MEEEEAKAMKREDEKKKRREKVHWLEAIVDALMGWSYSPETKWRVRSPSS